MTEPKRRWSYCNRCNHSTRHAELHHVLVEDEEVDVDHGICDQWTNDYFMLQCMGCDDVSMQISHWHSAYGDEPPQLYPPRISRKSPSWLWKLPSDWWSLMREIYGALHANSRRLAMMGARAVIDLYLTEAVGNSGSFEHRLNLLVASGQLAPNDKTTLKAALEAGNAAAHRGHIPGADDMSSAMDIVEHLLHGYVLKQAAANLQKNTPPRPTN